MAKGPSKEQLLGMVTEAAAPVAASFGLEIWGLELGGAGRPMVRIFVDTPVSAVPLAPDHSTTDNNAAAIDSEDGQGGVTIGQCAEISRLVGLALEVEDLFPDAWVLEVSSPGLERAFFRLEQLVPYIGREIDTVMWEPHPEFDIRRKFRGIIKSVDMLPANSSAEIAEPSLDIERAQENSGTFTLAVADADREVVIPWQSVRKARLIHIFPDTSKPGSSKDGDSKESKSKKAAKGGGK